MMEQDPDSRNYGSEEHRPRLPKHRKTTEPEDEEIRGPSGSSRSGIPVANLIAIAVTAALVFLILILLDGVVASPMPELIATIPMFFLDHTATAIARRKFDWPTLNGPLHTRPWYIAGVGYAALLLMVSLLEGALLNAVGGNLSQLGLINIATGVAAGVLIGWRSAGNRPVWTIIEAGFLVGLLGVLFDLVLLGREGSHAVHGRVAPLYLVMVNGLVFAGSGLLGYLGLSVWRHLRPPHLLLSPDGRHVWDGTAWRPVEPGGHAYVRDGKRVLFRPQHKPSSQDRRQEGQ